MTSTTDNEKPSAAELAVGVPIGRHLGFSLMALCVTLTLCGLVVANGSYLSSSININPGSFLFDLWPFNWVYLRQFTNSPYSASDIKWFFTVVSCSNAIWLVFIFWKVLFELFRKDIAFPTDEVSTDMSSNCRVLCCGLCPVHIIRFIGLSRIQHTGNSPSRYFLVSVDHSWRD